MVHNTVTVSWNAVPEADSYTYYLTEYPEGYAYTTNTATGTVAGNSVSFKDLTSGRYSVFVHANNAAGTSAQSNWVSFCVTENDYVPTVVSSYNGHIYALYDYSMSWSFAKQLCEYMGGHSVTITSQGEQDFIGNLISGGKKDAYWLGAYDFDPDMITVPYRWVTGEEFAYTNWMPGEPNGSGTDGTKEHFAEIRKSYQNQWNDVNNINKDNKGFILEMEPSDSDVTARETFNGHEYLVIDRNTTWTEAKAYCELMGGHLVTINSAAEQDFLYNSLLKQGSRYWYLLGASRQSADAPWTWVDGTAGNYITWNENASQWSGNYLMAYKGSSNSVIFNNTYYPARDIKHIGFVCEFDTAPHTHSLTATPKADASCTQDGTEAYWMCSECGKLFSDADGVNEINAPAVIPATGHSWDEGVVTQEPTTTSEGVKTFTCTVCGETRTEAIPVLEPVTNAFSDVPEGKFYTNAVLWAVNQNPQVTSGYADGTFRPDQTCTRAQVVTFLWRAKGCPEPSTTVNPFKDVSASAYYYKAVLWAVENNITTGYSDGTFRPDGECTRAHVVTFLWRMEGSPAPQSASNPFKDVPAGQFYTNAALWAVENGITTGYSDDTFRPDSACTRGHVVTFLYRAYAD